MKFSILITIGACFIASAPAAELTLTTGERMQYSSAVVDGDHLVLTVAYGKINLRKSQLSVESSKRFFPDVTENPVTKVAPVSSASPQSLVAFAPATTSPSAFGAPPTARMEVEMAAALLKKAGIAATVCEMPRVGDGVLATELARLGVAQVHGLASNPRAADAARKPAEAAIFLACR